jgi:hypothetical protein
LAVICGKLKKKLNNKNINKNYSVKRRKENVKKVVTFRSFFFAKHLKKHVVKIEQKKDFNESSK